MLPANEVQILESKDGFEVNIINRKVRVVNRKACFEIICGENTPCGTYYGFLEQEAIMDLISSGLRVNDCWLNSLIFDEGRNLIESQLHRLLVKVDPDVLTVHQRVCSLTDGVPPFAILLPELYQCKQITNDIINFRAAAIATCLADPVSDQGYQHDGELRLYPNSYMKKPPLGPLSNWRSMFSRGGSSYPILDEILMCLSENIPYNLAGNLSKTYLRRPILDEIELLTFLLYLESTTEKQIIRKPIKSWPYAVFLYRRHEEVFMFATSSQISEAMKLVANYFERKLTPGEIADTRFFVEFLFAYPKGQFGNIVNLARQAIDWHRCEHIVENLEDLFRIYENSSAIDFDLSLRRN